MSTIGIAQVNADTLALTLPEAEQVFLKQNLDLLAQKYNIDISRALVQQARYWDNPQLATDHNIYDGKFFRHKTENGLEYGQVYVQLSQLIKTAGKRGKAIDLARDEVLSSSEQFSDLLRNLRWLLAGDFNNLQLVLLSLELSNRELASLQQLASGTEASYKAGNVSLKENLRVKALVFSLQSDRAILLQQVPDLQKELHILLHVPDSVFILPKTRQDSLRTDSLPSLAQLIDSALANRPDLHLARVAFQTQQHMYSFQKAMAFPDLTAGIEYDHANSYVPNYWGLTLSLPLPAFNRNKGNIEASRIAIRQAESREEAAREQALNDVKSALQKLLIALATREEGRTELAGQYDVMLQNMINSYRDRQIGLVELIDFLGSYRDTRLRILQQQAAVNNAAAELNYTTATRIIPNF